MAQKVNVFLEDDIDGGAADETVTFDLDGRAYDIDLSKRNVAKLRKAPAPASHLGWS
jgi:Lsr2